jgi:hypothetical protein
MSTIQSNLASPAQSHAQLSRALINLSARTQSAASGEPAGSGTASADSAVPADLVQEVARQNQFSALADSSAALAANQTATGLIGSQPAAAYAAQATLTPETALGLLQQD